MIYQKFLAKPAYFLYSDKPEQVVCQRDKQQNRENIIVVKVMWNHMLLLSRDRRDKEGSSSSSASVSHPLPTIAI